MPNRLMTSQFLRVTALAMAAGAVPVVYAAQAADAVKTFHFHHADVLGTSLDLTVVAKNRADADAAEQKTLGEIDRLKKILSAYDADSELARLNASPVNGPGIAASPELIETLKIYEGWSNRTGGAYTGHTGDITALWKQAEQDGKLPTDDQLQAAATKNKAPAWQIDQNAKTVRRLSDQQIDLNSVGKGYIIDKAVQAATAGSSNLTGLLLNIGGDVRTWGQPTGEKGSLWAIGVTDLNHPELNATPLTTVYVPGGTSVSTSGAYQRFYTVDGKRYSHIIDARTGKPGKNPAATVIAPNSATANALATISCTMKFTEASQIVRAVPGADCLIVIPDGTQVRTDGFKDAQDKVAAAERSGPATPSPFPAGYKLTVDLDLVLTQRRPYVFAWVTDSAGKYVKTLAAYGNERRWMSEMHEWWKFASQDKKLLANTHATQAAGKYPLSWDGTNQQGRAVPLGKYNVWVEVAAEHGPYGVKFASVDIGDKPVTATIKASSAFKDVAIHYGPGTK